ncbi:hypothetical protein B0T26DRAFT_743737 [Lasiosphaeria miniovina]|uniref:Kinesin light chain n=1 Tax=Lasiosphaeria miniovina TaxID=1954250 RepID=A0AA39ZZF5_9PEZI|nr:uncharacterized protein B0T26DRAFT_743737 [Lasiosphaeria miniovina]KAK0706496.1 hypothetical protein B0T26DRAFT_743737 [Lasiosphaeria miniovina]
MLFLDGGCRTVALHGLGGMGKTQVALQLAHWVKTSKPGEASFGRAYAEIARELSIPKASDKEDVKESVRRHLSSKSAGQWFLVVDNADDNTIVVGDSSSDKSTGMCDYLPESEAGVTLFTTRSMEVAVGVASSDSGTKAADLLAELEYLPLAIYLKLPRGTEQDLVGLMSREFPDNTRYKESHNAVATTWLVSFEQIRKSNTIAANLLSFITHIEPKAIPMSLLPHPESDVQMVDAIGTLCGYAFLIRREGDSDVYDMHSLVHLATRIWVQERGAWDQEARKAIRHIEEVVPWVNYENRQSWRECIPHSIKILKGGEGLDMRKRAELLLWVGRCLDYDGRTKEALRCLEECQQWCRAYLPEDDPFLLATQHDLALTYLKSGKSLAEDHPSRILSQYNLALAYREDGQVKQAVKLLEHVVAVQSKSLTEDHPSRLLSSALAEDHPDRLVSQYTLASAYRKNGQVKQAVKLLEHVVDVDSKTLAYDHPDRLASQHELALVYRDDGRPDYSIDAASFISRYPDQAKGSTGAQSYQTTA